MSKTADVCLILEGTYPYIRGGVASWTHELILRQPDLTFHVLCILPKGASTEKKFELPANVVDITNVFLQDIAPGRQLSPSAVDKLMRRLEGPLTELTHGAGLPVFGEIYDILKSARGAGATSLLDSRAAWDLITRMYQRDYDESSYLDYFWSWRALLGGMLSVLLAELPKARTYHTLCTGYAGLMGARAKMETGRPLILTEHGIYTNERRIEIASADWLEETASKILTIDHTRRNLRDFWSDSFASYAKICYEAADRIVTLYEGNQRIQAAEGAPLEKLSIIPNGVDIQSLSAITLDAHANPTIALIGRVVPIKDIKSFLRSVSLLREQLPDIKAFIMGDADEDPEYVLECTQMVTYLGLADTVTFTGQVDVKKYLNVIDVVVVSSISEAQPLVVLEAGAAGVPVVATEVGACRELIYGRSDETPNLGQGGVVVPLSNPMALAEGVLTLLADFDRYQAASRTMKQRMALYYDKKQQHEAYRAIYDASIHAADESRVRAA